MRAMIATVFALAMIAAGAVQDRPGARGGTTQNPPVPEVQGKDKTTIVPGEAGSNPALAKPSPPKVYDTKGLSFRAQLLNPDQKLKSRSAAVKVTVSGIQLVDPDSVQGKARQGQGHLAYRVDMGPVVSTTATKLTFSQLPPGHHEILVELVANDETPLGPHDVIKINVP